MSKLRTLDYAALSLSGDNYLMWALDTKISLKSKGLGETIVEGNNVPEKNKYRAIDIIRHHLVEGLKRQYLAVEDPLQLWNDLKKRYDHQKTLILPAAKYDWINLRFQDFKSVDEYNSALFEIVSKMRLCGETVTEFDMLEKTLSTFPSQNLVLQQQYRERRYETYADLISCLLLAEKNNQLMMRNCELRPPGTAPLPETHAATEKEKETEANYIHKPSRRGKGNGRGRGSNHQAGRDYQGKNQYKSGRGNHSNRGKAKGRGINKPQHSNKSARKPKSVCYKCGVSNHWAKSCRTPQHLVDLYQASRKGKAPEANVAVEDAEGDFDIEHDDLLNYEITDDFETSDVLKEST